MKITVSLDSKRITNQHVTDLLNSADISQKVRDRISDDISIDNPIIIMMHGWGSNEGDLPGVYSYIKAQGGNKYEYFSLRAPLQLPVTMGLKAYAWIEEPVELDIAKLNKSAKDAVKTVIDWCNTNLKSNQKVILMGFSQGALMVSECLKSINMFNSKIVGAISMSGYISQNQIENPQMIKDIKTFMSYGLIDDVVEQSLLQEAANWYQNNTDATIKIYPHLSHTIDQNVASDLVDFLKELES